MDESGLTQTQSQVIPTTQDVEEVDAIFAKTQCTNEDEAIPFDYYVPLAVLIQNPYWYALDNENEVNQQVDEENVEKDVTLPQARVRKIMKMDPDVKVISKDSVQLMSNATVLFLNMLSGKINESMASEKNKTIKNIDVIQGCKRKNCFRFLLEDLALEEMGSKHIKVNKPKETPKSPEKPNEGIRSFFSKS